MNEALQAAIAAVKSLPLETRPSENHAALHLGIGRDAMGLLGDRYRVGSVVDQINGLAVSAASAGGVVLARRDEQGTPIPGEALKRIDAVVNVVRAVTPAVHMPAVHLGTTNDGARLLAEAGGVLGYGPTRKRVGLRYCGVDFLAWLDYGHTDEVGEVLELLAAQDPLGLKEQRASIEARLAPSEMGFDPKAKYHLTTGQAMPPSGDQRRRWAGLTHACDHGAIGGRCCPLPPRDTVVQHEGLRLEVRGDQLRVEADYGDMRIFRLWQLEDGVLPVAELRLQEALAVQQLAQTAPEGGKPPMGWQRCPSTEQVVDEVRQVEEPLDLSAFPLPLHSALYTRDGRKIGNALITQQLPGDTYQVVTDYGNEATLTAAEVYELFTVGAVNPTHKHAQDPLPPPAASEATWTEQGDGAWLLRGLPLGLSAAVYPPDDFTEKYTWQLGVGIDDMADGEALTLAQAQEDAEAAVLRLVEEAGSVLQKRRDGRARVAAAVNAAEVP